MCQITDTCTDVPLIDANKEICRKQLEDDSLNVIQAVTGMNDAVYENIIHWNHVWFEFTWVGKRMWAVKSLITMCWFLNTEIQLKFIKPAFPHPSVAGYQWAL